MKINTGMIKNYRKELRDLLDEQTGGKKNFTKREYKQRIKYTYLNFKKYYENFPVWLNVYLKYSNLIERFILKIIFGRKKINSLKKSTKKDIFDIGLDMDFISINQIYKCFRWLPLKSMFKDYFVLKTNLSYWLNENVFPIAGDKITRWFNNKQKQRNDKNKFAEFVYIIMSEYIVLHNYMWPSKLKLEEIYTIDEWMENICK